MVLLLFLFSCFVCFFPFSSFFLHLDYFVFSVYHCFFFFFKQSPTSQFFSFSLHFFLSLSTTETDLAKFTGMKVVVKFGEKNFDGVIEGGFGKSGKVKVVVRRGGLGEIKKGGGVGEGVVEMHFKKLIRVKDNKMYQ